MENDKKWRIILTCPNFEQKLVKTLRSRQIQSFCPHVDFTSFHNGETIVIRKNLLPGMLFLYIGDNQVKQISEIRYVTGFLYWRNVLAEVAQKDISTIYNFSTSFKNIKLEKCNIDHRLSKTPYVLPGKRYDGQVVAYLGSIGYKMIANQPTVTYEEPNWPILNNRLVKMVF